MLNSEASYESTYSFRKVPQCFHIKPVCLKTTFILDLQCTPLTPDSHLIFTFFVNQSSCQCSDSLLHELPPLEMYSFLSHQLRNNKKAPTPCYCVDWWSLMVRDIHQPQRLHLPDNSPTLYCLHFWIQGSQMFSPYAVIRIASRVLVWQQ